MARNDRGGWSAVIDCHGGCINCDGGGPNQFNIRWQGKNTLAVAARHYDKTGHHVWVETTMSTHYGADTDPQYQEMRSAVLKTRKAQGGHHD